MTRTSLHFGLLILLVTATTSSTSCTSLPKVVRELARDPATVHLSVRTLYGTVEMDRTAPTTNSLPHTVRDGRITVTR